MHTDILQVHAPSVFSDLNFWKLKTLNRETTEEEDDDDSDTEKKINKQPKHRNRINEGKEKTKEK